ncbi:MAG TPA: helix-turn-helix transcriptional regulator [Candidatus Dormibacteraeota bacterium]|nr:helix-turn-helix transcriptional regulator [Candidatus Dormibacteraeota bacterium]
MDANVCIVDVIRLGRVVRALRIRHGWRQTDLASRVGVSQSLVARVERGGADRLTVKVLEAIVVAVGARLNLRVDWNGEAADRLLDADHAALVEMVLRILRDSGWEAVPEVSFAINGERGSIDILGWHAASETLLIIEVKSVIPDVQATLFVFDRKVRLAGTIGAARSWRPRRVGQLIVVAEGRTARRRVEMHAATFEARLPDRGRGIRAFLTAPADHAGLRGLWFLSARTGAGSRQRVVRGRRAA